MALQEFEPNDIVIHLVNPYKCGDCGSEFCVRSLFIEHFNEHIEKLKSESPCHQIIFSTSLVEHQPNGITVTRDILQINEQQMFELQDPSLDYTQLTPLKTLEQAGILNLPPPRQIYRSSVKSVHREPPIILTVQEGDIITDVKKISLLGSQRLTGQEVNPLHIQMVGDLGVKYNEPQVCVQQVVEGGNVSFDLDAIMQQSLVDKIKEEFRGTIDGSVQNDAISISAEENIPTNFSTKKGLTCPVCLNTFASASVLERHQVVHQGVKPYPCMKCFKQFNDISSMRKHMLIHKRQHRCPICHRMFLQRFQLSVHMRQHSKRRFIQFGKSFHEVRVVVTRNETGQQVQEYSLLALMTEDQLTKVNMPADAAETSSNGCGSTVTAELNKSDNTAVVFIDGNEIEDAQSHGCNELKKKIVYKCGHCEKLIFWRRTLSRHLVKHTNTRPFQCEVCSKAFRDKADLFRHSKTHTKPVQCSTCGTQFSKVLYLQNHMLKGCPVSNSDDRFTVLENLKCQCKVCKKVLKNKGNMLRHLKVHAFQDGQKRTKNNAVERNKGFSENLSDFVEDHYRRIENSVGFSCLICGQEFRFKSFIITHVRMHLNLRPYKCEQCSKRFFAQHMLKKHIQNHTRPYKCPVCGRGFIRRYLMKDHYKKRHEDSHEDVMRDITELVEEKKIQCDICGKTMKSYQKSLMLHHIRQHKDFRPFVCQTCQKTFTSNTALKKHLLNHSKPYVCQVCKHGFSRRYLLTDHFKKKCCRIKGDKVKIVVKSMQSSKAEGVADKLTNSLVGVDSGELPSVPLAEGESFETSLITVVNPATGATTYACEPCDKKFALYGALLRHVNTFAKPTPCKYCKTVFKDKHLAISHQRSCLGTPIDIVLKTGNKADSKVIGEQEVKIQKIMKAISEKIEQISSTPSSEQDDRGPSMPQHSDSSDVIPEKNLETKVEMSTLNKTLQALREDTDKYKCPECTRSFTSIRGMKIHASSHVRLFKCEVCGKDFINISHFRAHVQTHKDVVVDAEKEEVECENKSFAEDIEEEDSKGEGQAANNEKLDLPMALKAQIQKKRKLEVESDGGDDEPEVKITTKDILDVTQRLMGTGTRGRPFSCKMCRRRFTESAGLKSHMLQIHGMKT